MTGNIFLLPLTFLVFLRSSALSPEQYTFSLWRVIPRSHKIAQCWDAEEPLAFLLPLWISVSLLWTVSVPGKMKKENVLVFFFTIIYASTSIEYKETVLVSLCFSTHLISLYFASNKPDFYLFKVVSNNSSPRFLRDFQPSPFFIGMFACLFVKPCNTDLWSI